MKPKLGGRSYEAVSDVKSGKSNLESKNGLLKRSQCMGAKRETSNFQPSRSHFRLSETPSLPRGRGKVCSELRCWFEEIAADFLEYPRRIPASRELRPPAPAVGRYSFIDCLRPTRVLRVMTMDPNRSNLPSQRGPKRPSRTRLSIAPTGVEAVLEAVQFIKKESKP